VGDGSFVERMYGKMMKKVMMESKKVMMESEGVGVDGG